MSGCCGTVADSATTVCWLPDTVLASTLLLMVALNGTLLSSVFVVFVVFVVASSVANTDDALAPPTTSCGTLAFSSGTDAAVIPSAGESDGEAAVVDDAACCHRRRTSGTGALSVVVNELEAPWMCLVWGCGGAATAGCGVVNDPPAAASPKSLARRSVLSSLSTPIC
jgi:hypothetical protein